MIRTTHLRETYHGFWGIEPAYFLGGVRYRPYCNWTARNTIQSADCTTPREKSRV